MARASINQARQDVGRDLDLLGRALGKISTACPDVSPLTRASARCRSGQGLSAATWGYSLENLVFRPKTTNNAIPRGVYPISVDLSVRVESTHWNDGVSADPFDLLEFNIVISGEHNKRKLFFSWHLDRDLREQDEGDNQV